MLYLDNNPIPGLEQASVDIFGNMTVTGRFEIARTHRDLDEDRFYQPGVIPVIGDESMARSIHPGIGAPPDMLGCIRIMQPPGLVTFGVGSEQAARRKNWGTHLDVILRDWAYAAS